MSSRFGLRSFLLGGVLGGLAGLLAAARMDASRRRRAPDSPGLRAFEEAPCRQEWLEREGAESDTAEAGQ